MSTPTTNIWKYLEPDPRSFYYKQYFVKGTRVLALDLYLMHTDTEDPMTLEEVAAEAGVPLEAVREAIAYCRSNPPEIEEDIRRSQALSEASGMPDDGHEGNVHRKPTNWEAIGRYFNS